MFTGLEVGAESACMEICCVTSSLPPRPVMVSCYCSVCSVLVLLGQFVFSKWEGLVTGPFLYPVPVVVVMFFWI